MASPRRVGRYALYGAAGLVGLAVLGYVGVGVYLRTGAGRGMVAQQLTAAIGLPVEVESAAVGMRSSSLTFRILDPALGTGPDAEVLGVDDAEADVSLPDLLAGRSTPTTVTLRGVRLTLRIDAAGKVLTTLPKKGEGTGGGRLPTLLLEDARVTIRQEGRPEFALGGIRLRAEPADNGLKLSGTAADPGWGEWAAAGTADTAAGTFAVELTTADAPLEVERLKSIPYVPLSVWANVRPAGRGAASVGLAQGTDKEFRYDVGVRPKGAALGIVPADITLADVVGLIRVKDGAVEVSGDADGRAAARLAGGRVTVGGRWDYAQEPAVIDPLAVTADGLAVEALPETWGLSRVLPGKLAFEGGRLSGEANLKLLAHADGRLETFGGGTGTIAGKLAGGSAEIGVKLGGDGQKLEFGRAAPPPKPPEKPKPFSRGPGGAEASPTITTPRELAALLAMLMIQPPAKDAPRTDQTDLDATITLRDVDVGELVQQLELKVPYQVTGKVTVQAKLGVPLGQAATRSAYRLTGTLSSPQLTLEGLTVRDLTTEVTLQDGKLTLSKLTAQFPQPGDPNAPAGSLSGTASAAIDPVGDIAATLTLDRIPVGPVLSAIPGLGVDARGLASGQASFKAPYQALGDPATWIASANLTSPELVVFGRSAKGVAFAAAVEKGTLTLTEGKVTVEGIPLTAAGTLGLTGKYTFDATVKTTGTNVADLRKLVPEAELPVPVEGVFETESKVTGTLSPLTYTAAGRVRASKLTLDKTPANDISVNWEVTPERVKLTDLTATIFGGTLTGSAEYPLVADKGGAFDIVVKEVDAAAASAFVPGFPVEISGAVSGKVAGTIPPAKDGAGRVGNLDVDITAPRLLVKLNRILKPTPVERLTAKAVIRGGAIEYAVEGKTLSGSVEGKGRYSFGAKKEPPPKGQEKGYLRLTGIDLAQLAAAVGGDALRPLAGRLDLTFDYDNDFSAGNGRVSVRGLRWGRDELSPEIAGALLLRDGQFELRDLTGSLAGGSVRGRARVSLDDPARNFFSLVIDRADGKRLLAAVPGAAGLVDGDVSLVVRGRVGTEIRGSGTVSIGRGTVGGVEVTEFRVPFDFATAPGGYGRLTVRGASTRAGLGRATADLSVEWGAGVRVNGQARLIDVPVAALAPGLGESALFGNGRVTGRFDLSGTNVRSSADLTGTLVAALSNTSVREVPLLQQTVPYLNTLGLTRPFQSGDVRGTLRGGIFRVQRLALANPSAQVFADGTVTTAGRLDLHVVAHTGTIGPQARGLRLLLTRLPIAGPVPIGLIKDVSDFLQNRTIRLTITGTTAAPVVRVNAGALLADEAVRFFLSRYVPVDVAAVLGLGSAGAAVGGAIGGGSMPQR